MKLKSNILKFTILGILILIFFTSCGNRNNGGYLQNIRIITDSVKLKTQDLQDGFQSN